MPSAKRTLTVTTTREPGGTIPNLPLSRFMRSPGDHAGGVRAAYDGAHVGSVANDTDPTNGSAVGDLSKNAQATWFVAPTQTVDYAGDGWDLSPLTALGGAYLVAPGSISADIWGDGTVHQYFGECVYVKLQASADWNPNSNIVPYISFTEGQLYSAVPEMGGIFHLTNGTTKQIQFIRSDSLTTRDVMSITVPAAAFGKFAQLAIWRDATGTHGLLRYDDGANGASVAIGPLNTRGECTVSFANQKSRIGHQSPYSTPSLAGTSNKWKLYAAFIENLRTSGRNFQAVLDSDWAWRLQMYRNGDYA